MRAHVILAAAILVSACGEKKEDTKAEPARKDVAASPAVKPTPPPPPAPFTGTLTGDRIMAAKDMVKPYDPWENAFARLQGQMGKPTQVDGKAFVWAVLEGDTCTYIKVEQMDNGGAQVGGVYAPMKVQKDGPVMNWDECLAGAGQKKPEAAEDPNAPAPPTDGSAVTVTQVLDGVKKAKSKWLGQNVKVKALYLGTTTMTGDAKPTTTVSLTGAKGDLTSTIGCTLADGATVPDTLIQYDELTLQGKVTEASGGGLQGCTLVTEKAPAPKGKAK